MEIKEVEIDCPICNDGKKHVADVLKVTRGKVRRGRYEYDAVEMIVRCRDCGTVGAYRKIESVNMESYEFPYEGEI
ncbi:MAG: hypothetical protein DRP01_05850 [Archaeoglobales archaeon]|nr:MAG: hypothetical protein DRP01_05850 [Archaeoglobales archaeon]